MADDPGAILCVANFQASYGYAWDLIEGLFGRVADHVALHGIRTIVAYPLVEASPHMLAGTTARAVQLDASLGTPASVRAVAELVRRERVKAVYFTDRPAWSGAYARLRRAGARRIIVHDHTSGERTSRAGALRTVKWVLARVPFLAADRVLAVSNYVARRLIEVTQVPESRVLRIHNGLPVPQTIPEPNGSVQRALGIPPERPLIVAASRATPEKGIAYLLRAFDRLLTNDPPSPRPALVYVGDGPQLGELRALRESLAHRDDMHLLAYRRDATTIVDGATLCVVPSVWQDAFPTSVLEALLRAKPVIASRVGGIPEMIEDGVTGRLVPPEDEVALARAMRELLRDGALARRFGHAGRNQAVARFSSERQARTIIAELERAFGAPCAAMAGETSD
ncbi:MAG: glycosyltransferase family 4 protein [Gemmatimonadaceae bacterium]